MKITSGALILFWSVCDTLRFIRVKIEGFGRYGIREELNAISPFIRYYNPLNTRDDGVAFDISYYSHMALYPNLLFVFPIFSLKN